MIHLYKQYTDIEIGDIVELYEGYFVKVDIMKEGKLGGKLIITEGMTYEEKVKSLQVNIGEGREDYKKLMDLI